MRDYAPLRERAAKSGTVLLKSETVNELLDELDALRAAAKPARTKRNDYPVDFEEVWGVYPSRPGASKQATYKAWTARIKAGAKVADMLAGARNYAAYAAAMEIEPRFIKLAETFFGPSEFFTADWTVPEQRIKPAGGGAWWLSDITRLAKANEVGVGPAHFGETAASWEARIRAAIDNGGKPPAPQVYVRPPEPAGIALGQSQDETRMRKPAGFLKDMLKQAQEKSAA